MKNSLYRKGLIIGVIFLLIGIGISPIACSMKYTIEKNDEMVENFDTATTPFGRSVRKIYFIGQIDNLSINGDYYEFHSNNLRKFMYHRFSLRDWGFEYYHHTNIYVYIGGFNFRGILRPNFICGVFYT